MEWTFGRQNRPGEARFDIEARAGQPIDDDSALMAMLRTLLAERFHLVAHRESKPIAAYVLTVARNGPRLEKALDGEATTNSGHGSIDARVITMQRFAEVLSRQMDFPVVDQTRLEGAFNVNLKWSPESDRPVKPGELPALDTGPSVFTAIQQLGLRLQARKTPVDVLVIDHAEMPSEN
ncbi:MAG: TIGR03435 family protein [Acidobacteriota bacterium]